VNSPTWNGYLRDDGRKGIRDLVLVVYTVECAAHVARLIADGEPDVHVIGFPGCYGNEYASRLMLALACHPNVGAVLAVGLGCEYTQPAHIAEAARQSGRPARWFWIQEEGGTRASIDSGKRALADLRVEMAATRRIVPMTLADLTVGAECGGSDSTSGLAGNPVVGSFFDVLVASGGCAVFEETVELIGLREILRARAANAAAEREILAAYDKAERYCREVRQYSIAPGNFAGGLTTIEEKSMGAFAKSGSRPIEGVIRVAERPRAPGLWLLDSVPDPHFMQFGYTNPNDTEGIMDLLSTGAQLVLFVTGRGSVTGSAVGPIVKVTGNSATFKKMRDDMDFDAGRLLDGSITMDRATRELLDLVARVAAGEPSRPEALGHREYFIMYKHQSSPDLKAGCHA
jgi:altronate hydrolase